MSKSDHEDLQSFSHELDQYRAIISQYKEQLEVDPWLAKQISFWMESMRFLISELEIWDRLGNNTEYDRSARRIQKVRHQLYALILQLTNES